MEALHAWHEFYLLVGTAAATVLALLFVAVSLGAGHLTSQNQAPTRTFMRGEAKIDAIPYAREFRVVVDLLRVERDAGKEAERLAEILEFQRLHQRLVALLECPTVRNVHSQSLQSLGFVAPCRAARPRFPCPTGQIFTYRAILDQSGGAERKNLPSSVRTLVKIRAA